MQEKKENSCDYYDLICLDNYFKIFY